MDKHKPTHWQQSKCRVPQFYGTGAPAGFCDEKAYGHQLPYRYLYQKRSMNRNDLPFCFGHCCPNHGGPREGDPIIFQDGHTKDGYPMWCAVMPDHINLQESPAGFDADPLVAEENLKTAIAKARGQQ